MSRQQAPQPVVRPNLVPQVELPANGDKHNQVNVLVDSDVSLTKEDIESHLHLVVRDSSTSPATTHDVTEWVDRGNIISANAGSVSINISAPSWPTQLFNINLTTDYSVSLMEIKWDV